MKPAWQLVTGPTEEPLSQAAAREHLRISDVSDDADVARKVRGARTIAEQYLGRGILTQTWKYAQDYWTDVIPLPMAAPLQSVTTVKYYNASGTLTTLASTYYNVVTLTEPGCVVRAPLQVWPVLQSDRPLAIEITYVVGWTSAAAVPGNIIAAIEHLLGDEYLYREDIVAGFNVDTLPLDARRKLSDRVFWTPACQ